MTRAAAAALALIGTLAAASAACSTGDSTPAATPGTVSGASMDIELRHEPPRPGSNDIEVMVQRDRTPVDGATVTAVFSMPSMPSMNMPEMHSSAALSPAGGGRYRGRVDLSMAGTWNVKVTVAMGSEELGSYTSSVVAK
jgi:hypothetical protein